MSKDIIDNDHYKVMFKRGRSDFVWVTFGQWGHPLDYYWGEKIAENLGYSLLSFLDKQYSWYAGVSDCFPQISSILNDYPTRLGSGVSMGAYAAIKYSSALKFDATLAAVPQFSINPCDVNDFRYRGWFRPEIHSDMAIKPGDVGGAVYALVDPHYEPDMAHYRRLQQVCAPVLIPVHYYGHFAVGAYQGTEKMSNIITALMAGDISTLRKNAHEGRKSSKERPAGLISAAWKRNKSVAQRLLRRYGRRVSSNILQDALAELSREMSECGNNDVAIDTMKEALAIVPENYNIQYEYSRLLYGESLRLADAAALGGDHRYIAWRNSIQTPRTVTDTHTH